MAFSAPEAPRATVCLETRKEAGMLSLREGGTEERRVRTFLSREGRKRREYLLGCHKGPGDAA